MKGFQHIAAEGYLTLGAEHTMQHKAGSLENCILETYVIILTSVTPIKLVKKENHIKYFILFDKAYCFESNPVK